MLGHGMRMRVKFRSGPERNYEWKLDELKYNHSKTSFEKKLFFCVGEYAEYGFDQQG